MQKESKKAIILLSGGLDSLVCLAIALEKKRQCIAISFDYSQRHLVELQAAKKIANYYNIPHHIIKIDPTIFSSSALLSNKKLPQNRDKKKINSEGIPPTYVPARNLLFLSYATGFAEKENADEIFIGANADDKNAYPDCRPIFYQAFQNILNVATKQAVESSPPKIITPLSELNKEEIVKLGKKLLAPLELSHSCYNPNEKGKACGICDACMLRPQF